MIAAVFFLVAPSGAILAQSPHEKVLAFKTLAQKPTWDALLDGKWTYRSYLNRPDIVVGANADPAVQSLVPIYGQGVTVAASSLKALDLIFGEGVMTFDTPAGNSITGNFDMGGGYVLDLKGTMQTSTSGQISVELFGMGRAGTKTDNWEYDYKAFMAPKWPNGVNQVPSLVGTVVRAKPHDGAPAGVVASFIALKQ